VEAVGREATTVDTGKLSTLLDDPEVRVIVYGLAHAYPGLPRESGPQRLRTAIQRLTETADPAQVESWLSDEAANRAITVEQVRAAFGDEVIGNLAGYAGGEPDEVAWQLRAILPDLVDAFSPGGVIVDPAELRREFIDASAAGDRSAGPFAPHID
jgi:uncharacterized protein YidB (DUF937 family)